MSEVKLAIITGVTGLITTIAAWVLGGKQLAKNNNNDAITRGTDQIVETSGKLLKALETMLDDEREHRANCETQLAQLKAEIDSLNKKFNDIKKSNPGFSLN